MGAFRPKRWVGLWPGLAVLLAFSGCGPQGGLPGGGSPAVGQSGTPIDLTDPSAAKSRFLVWASQTVEPPAAVATTDAGVALGKAGPGGGALFKALAGSECPVVDFVGFDPDSGAPLPDPLLIHLDYQRADLGRCVSGGEEMTGRVELTVRGAVVLAGGELLPRPGVELEVTESYPSWTHKVAQPSGDVIAYSFGGSRTLQVDGGGAVRVTSPLVIRRAVQRTADGTKVGADRLYQVSNLAVTRTPVDGLGGPGTAWREDGGLRLASSLDGYTDVVLSGVVRDPALCDGAPTDGTMRFQNGGPAVIVTFNYDYVGNSFYCGRASVLRPGFGEPQLEVFDAVPPVL